MKVLIAEESEPLARMVQELVKLANCEPVRVKTKDDLLQKWKSAKKEFFLLVINASFGGQPDSGILLGKKIQGKQGDIGLLVLSDKPGVNPETYGLNKGVNFLQKPFLPRQVQELIALQLEVKAHA